MSIDNIAGMSFSSRENSKGKGEPFLSLLDSLSPFDLLEFAGALFADVPLGAAGRGPSNWYWCSLQCRGQLTRRVTEEGLYEAATKRTREPSV